MEYAAEILKRSDFSKETNLMNTLRRQLFPVREISLDYLMKKNDVCRGREVTRKPVVRNRDLSKDDVLDKKVPKKNGPHM